MLLKDVAEIIFSFPDKCPDRPAQWLYSAFLQERNVITETKTENQFKLNPAYKVQECDIIIKRIQPQFVNYISTEMDAYVGQNLVIVRSRGDVDAQYLAYILERDLSKLYKDTTGATLTALNRKGFDEFDLGILPTRQRQKAIGQLWWLSKEKAKLQQTLLVKEQQVLEYKLKSFTK